MLREDFSDLPELQLWGFKPQEASLGSVRSLERVRMGQLSSYHYRSAVNTALAASHVLSDITPNQKEQIAKSFVTYADLELVDCQYLLCGLGDGGVAIYDTSDVQEGRVYKEVGSVQGGQRGSHKYQVECAQWYPADTGLFSTSSRDKKVKIWDPNYMKPVELFTLNCHVLHHHMSPIATKHSLLSAAGDTGEVILCDLRTGSSTHRLVGHEGPVQMTQWSPRLQHILASAGRDHTVRLWDVRAGRANLIIFDGEKKEETQKSRLKKKLKKVPHAHKTSVISLCFTSDGLWLLSFSYSGDLKLWNASTGENQNVDYGEIYTEIKRNLRMAVTHCMYPDLVFIPCKSKIVVYEIHSGNLVNVLKGHFSSVLGVVYNPSSMNLYSFSTDRAFITWVPKRLLTSDLSEEEEEEEEEEEGEEEKKKKKKKRRSTRHQKQKTNKPATKQVIQDNWSSDED